MAAAQETAPIISAGQSFHDLKPLPRFFPQTLLSWWVLALIVLSAAALAWVWTRRNVASRYAPRSADDLALAEIDTLEKRRSQNQIGIRDFAATLSFTVRSYFEETLFVPATDLTSAELLTVLPPVLDSRLGETEAEHRRRFVSSLKPFFKECDAIAFGAYSETGVGAVALGEKELHLRARALVSDLAELLRASRSPARDGRTGGQESRP